ncbi:MAG: YdbH domain-containing protein [Cycloclasticus sp.]
MLKNRATSLFFSVLILLPILLLGVYLAFPLIAEALLKNTFNEHDIELIELQVPRPSFNELTTRNIQLESLAFRLKDKTEVAIRGVRFSLENDDFYSANISSITVQRTAVEDSESVEELDLLTLLPATLMRDLPMARLFVQSLALDAPAIKLDNLIVDISRAKITAKVYLNTVAQGDDRLLTPFLKSDISLDISPDNKIELQVSDANSAHLLGIGLSLSTKEDRLYGTLNVNNTLANVEWPMSNDEMVVVKNSQLNASAEFSLPVKQRVTPNDLSQLLIHGQLQQNAHISVGKQLGDTQLSSNASLDASLDKGQWRLSLSQDKTPFILAKGRLASAFYPTGHKKKGGLTDTLTATINKPLVIKGSLSADAAISIDAGDMVLSYLEGNKQLIDMRLSDVDVATPDSSDEQKNSLTLYSKIDIDKLGERVALSGLSLDSIKGVLNSRVSVQANRLRLEPLSKSRILLSHFRFNDYYAKQLALDVPQQGIDVDLNSFEFSNIALGLDGKGLVLSDANIKKWALQSKVSFKANHLVLDSTTEAMNAEVSGANHYVPPLVVKTNIQLDKASVKKASIKLANICNDPLLNVNWRTVKKKAEVLELQWKRTFSHTKTLRQWLNTSVIPVDFTQGTFSGRVIVDINENKTNIRAVDVSLKDIQGVNAMGTFEGVQLRLSSPLRRSTQHGAIKFDTLLASLNGEVDELNMGVKLNDVAFNSVIYDRHSDWQLKLPLMTAKLFSGAMEIRDEDINFNKEIQINVLLKQVDLSELIATQQVEGLQTTGKMSGSIPIRYANGQVQVLDGTMRSVEKGKIRYSTALSESGDLNEQLKLTLDVLENFDYSSLNSKIVYDADTLLLESSIVGKNPDIKNGQTINLNLNTEVGLKGAVEVMRIQSGIDSRIEKFMASKAAPNTKQYFCQ